MRACRRWLLALAWVAIGLTGAAKAAPGSSSTSGSSRFCSQTQPLTATQQDRLLRFAAVVRDELGTGDDGAVLISRSGLDLSRFHIRYSHAAIAWRDDQGTWSARQLYYACNEGRPRIYDQGLAGFAMGIDDASLGYISIVKMPSDAAHALQSASLDSPRVLQLLAARYSANAYAYSLRYQNCNQWVMELLAMAWGNLGDGSDLRERAQRWLRQANYSPQPVDVHSRWLMLASRFVPLLHLDDHPKEDRAAMKLHISLPVTVEAFVQAYLPASERIEICHDGKQVVVHRGWSPIADGCLPGEGDRVVPLG